MIDISAKPVTRRTAVACGAVEMQRATWQRIVAGQIEKGDVFAVARVAGIIGAKRTPDLIPLCHPLQLSAVEVHFEPPSESHSEPVRLGVTATVTAIGQTGVEMEAIMAVSTASITIYDMCKGIDKGMILGPIRLVSKAGGRSGDYLAPEMEAR
jgi:cyclic pyranopterin phosphate synthase